MTLWLVRHRHKHVQSIQCMSNEYNVQQVSLQLENMQYIQGLFCCLRLWVTDSCPPTRGPCPPPGCWGRSRTRAARWPWNTSTRGTWCQREVIPASWRGGAKNIKGWPQVEAHLLLFLFDKQASFALNCIHIYPPCRFILSCCIVQFRWGVSTFF